MMDDQDEYPISDDNPFMFVVRDYKNKYPLGDRNGPICDEDVVRPRNHKWADEEEQEEWRTDNYLSTNAVATYGTCAVCWASGPNYFNCSGPNCIERHVPFKPLRFGPYILDSQTFSEKMKKPHRTAAAGLIQDSRIIKDTMSFDRTAITRELVVTLGREPPICNLKNDEENENYENAQATLLALYCFFKPYDNLLNGR
jgi:hypothetical protein